MMDLDEALSRLLDGDLSPEEEASLRARIANEPDVAERYASMQALVTELELLPEELPAPVPRVRRSMPVWAAAGWLVAAAAVVFALLPSVPPHTTQVSGSALYEGLHRVEAGDLQVEVDGKVAVRVQPNSSEPRSRVVRGEGQEDSMKAMSHAIAAAAGALVTVTVYEGTATVQGATDPSPVTLEAGASHGFGGASHVAARRAPVVPGAPDEERVAELEQELDRLREELGQERFAKVLMKGQLEAERGMPTEWPEDVSEAMSPAGFPEALAELVTQIPDIELVQTDCVEYPCVGALRYTGTEPGMGWMEGASRQVKDWVEEGMGDQVSLNMSGMADGEDADSSRYILFGAHGDERGSNTSQRLSRRMEELGTQLIDDAAVE